jgi:membrane associated rhomboid family serine protease
MPRGGFAQLGFQLPRPGRVIWGLLVVYGVVGIVNALIYNFGSPTLFAQLVCNTDRVLHHTELWRLFTAGLLTVPSGPGSRTDLLFTLLLIYFFATDLEKTWGARRFLFFFGTSLLVGFLLAIAVDLAMPQGMEIFHPQMMLGAGAAITATIIAWSKMNADTQTLFFFFPMRGRQMFWLAIAYCVLGVVFWDHGPVGVMAPFGGILVGLLMGGSPSVLRTIYLKTKLAMLRRQESQMSPKSGPGLSRGPKPSRSTREGGPPLRIVYGGLEDELKKRKPPKDKRYLN